MSMLIALTFSLLATLSIPDARGLSLAVFDIQGSSTSPAGRVVLGVWGWSAKGAFRWGLAANPRVDLVHS
jgi:hypothetical protein